MFLGSIPQTMRQIVHEVVGGWPVADIYVGCSGNFTIERVLGDLNRYQLHGCDVTLYSCILGAYMSRQPFRIGVRENMRPSFDWLTPYLAEPHGAVATVMLGTRLADFIDSAGELKANHYYQRMLTAYRAQWPTLFEKSAKKIEVLPTYPSNRSAASRLPLSPATPS